MPPTIDRVRSASVLGERAPAEAEVREPPTREADRRRREDEVEDDAARRPPEVPGEREPGRALVEVRAEVLVEDEAVRDPEDADEEHRAAEQHGDGPRTERRRRKARSVDLLPGAAEEARSYLAPPTARPSTQPVCWLSARCTFTQPSSF